MSHECLENFKDWSRAGIVAGVVTAYNVHTPSCSAWDPVPPPLLILVPAHAHSGRQHVILHVLASCHHVGDQGSLPCLLALT